MKELSQIDDIIYYIGWNKRFELARNGRVLFYRERKPDGSSIRLRCDTRDKRMVVEKKEKNEEEFVKMNELNIIKGAIVDLGDNGERWEGDLLNGLPFGYGYVYNIENELVYSGFMYEGDIICFGEEFRQSKVEYCGTYYMNQRHGYGKLYNLKGEMVYEGNWYFGKNYVEDIELTPELDDSIVHNGMRKLIIGDGYHCDLKELKLTDFPVLKSISVGDDCFEGMKIFEISNCVKLEIVVIGKNSFYDEKWGKDNFLIHDCGNLKNISIDEASFNSCDNLTLESKFDRF